MDDSTVDVVDPDVDVSGRFESDLIVNLRGEIAALRDRISGYIDTKRSMDEYADGLAHRVRDLTTANDNQVLNIKAYQDEVAELKRQHQFDIATIGEVLIQEANERGYCGVYDDVIEGINRKLHVQLPTRSHDFRVTLSYNVTIRRTVRANDETDAVGAAQEDYTFEQALRRGLGSDWDVLGDSVSCYESDAELSS